VDSGVSNVFVGGTNGRAAGKSSLAPLFRMSISVSFLPHILAG